MKVGGGFLSLDEFLDQYSHGELEKLERRDPLKKFSEKVGMHKVLCERLNTANGSPCPTSRVSPLKKQFRF